MKSILTRRLPKAFSSGDVAADYFVILEQGVNKLQSGKRKEQLMQKIKTYHIYLIAVVTVILALSYLWSLSPDKSRLVYELSKLLMQLLVVGLIGGAVKTAIDSHIKERDKRSEKILYYREVLQSIAKCYTDTKRVRRSLNTEIAIKGNLSFPEYKKFIDDISDIQLEFEMLNIELKSTFTEENDVYKNIKKMEEYLKSIVKGFSERVGNNVEDRNLVCVSAMSSPEKDFLMYERNSLWYQDFIIPVQNSRKYLNAKILSE